MKRRKRTWDSEGESRERHCPVFESFQIGNDVRRIVVLFAPRPLAEVVDTLLCFRAGKTRRVDSEISLQICLFNKGLRPRRNCDFRSEVHQSGQSRTIRLCQELEPILDSAFSRLRQANGLILLTWLPSYFTLRYD